MNIPDAHEVLRQAMMDYQFGSMQWMLMPEWWAYSLLNRPFPTAWLAVLMVMGNCILVGIIGITIETIATCFCFLYGTLKARIR